MGIYISDLDIPKGKAVQIVIIRDDGVCVDEWGNTYEVVSLPQHGDLIDKQALFNGEHNLYSWDEIDEAPTIIEAEPCNDLAKPNNTIFAVQNADEDEWLFAAKPIDYMHTPSVEEIIEADGE